jgi:hypothetical protein
MFATLTHQNETELLQDFHLLVAGSCSDDCSGGKGPGMRSGGAGYGDPETPGRAPVLPEYAGDAAEPDFEVDMAEAIVAARRTEFAALSDLNDSANWESA